MKNYLLFRDIPEDMRLTLGVVERIEGPSKTMYSGQTYNEYLFAQSKRTRGCEVAVSVTRSGFGGYFKPCYGVTWPGNVRCIIHGGGKKVEYLKRAESGFFRKLIRRFRHE